MKKKTLIILIIILLVLLAGAALVLLRGDEDTWLCVDGQWVEHGHPAAPAPTSGCGASGSPASSTVESSSKFIIGQRQEPGGLTLYSYSLKQIRLQFESNYAELPLRFEENKLYTFDPKRPSVEFFDMSNNVTYSIVLNNLINIFGKNPANCRIATSSASTSTGAFWTSIEPIKEYQPSTKEVLDYLKNEYPSSTDRELKKMVAETPEGGWASDAIKAQHTEDDCSQYAKCYKYKCGSGFFYDSVNAPQRLFYLYDAGGGDWGFYSGNNVSALPE